MIAKNANHEPTAYAYACASQRPNPKDAQIPAQEARCRQYFDRSLKKDGVFGGTFMDRKTYAHRDYLFMRKGGFALRDALKPSDHIIAANTEHVIRSIYDWFDIHHWCDSHEVTLHIVDFTEGIAIRTDSPEAMVFEVQKRANLLVLHAGFSCLFPRSKTAVLYKNDHSTGPASSMKS